MQLLFFHHCRSVSYPWLVLLSFSDVSTICLLPVLYAFHHFLYVSVLFSSKVGGSKYTLLLVKEHGLAMALFENMFIYILQIYFSSQSNAETIYTMPRRNIPYREVFEPNPRAVTWGCFGGQSQPTCFVVSNGAGAPLQRMHGGCPWYY